MKATLARLLVASLSVVAIGCTPATRQQPTQPTPPTNQPSGGLQPSEDVGSQPTKQPTTQGNLKSDADIEAQLNKLNDGGPNVDEPAASDDDLDSF